ncbi:heavy metal-associated isoprenylated plant protein 5-like [Impatiens glandulifera]|uniref:heavy metal-associated isoprenylated plant protein 5-like n=1 Tax=Impatiens glandulifera TaxID=253017 RepID=UPI001FB16B29|nr:heavy metal-associated isoprenylated plant protein 5-like [Impatiens glandulifera]
MVLNIFDLKCPCCYKKVKKLLCKFPQIRNQIFDEKQNTVSITVVCCSPEEIRHKIAKKGGKTIKSVEIKESQKPKESEKPKSDAKPDKPPKEDNKPDKPKGDDKKPDKPKGDDKKPEKPKGDDNKPEKPKGEAKEESKPKEIPPAAMMMTQVPIGYPYCMAPPPTYYDGGYPGEPSYGGGYVRAVPVYDSYGGGYYGNNRPYDYLNEENPTGCTIM